MYKRYFFRALSIGQNNKGLFTFEPVAMSGEFDTPYGIFHRKDGELHGIAIEIGERFSFFLGIEYHVFCVTDLPTVTRRGRRYFKGCKLYPKEGVAEYGIEANDILDIRDVIEYPKGIRFSDCEFFILYPNGEQFQAEEYEWLVAVPCGRERKWYGRQDPDLCDF